MLSQVKVVKYPRTIKLAFWVIKNKKPELVEGILIPEPEGEWSEGELRFHDLSGKHVFLSWFDEPQSAIKYELKMEKSRIDFEIEMCQDSIKEYQQEYEEVKDYWENVLKIYENKNE